MVFSIKTVLWATITLLEVTYGSSLFECTAEENGMVSTPNIPDSYFNPVRAGELRTQHIPVLETAIAGRTYIFTIPSVYESQRNCSGNVTALEYCYETDTSLRNSNRALFVFFSLTESLMVNSKFLIELTPAQDSSCTDKLPGGVIVCCGQSTLEPSNSIALSSAPYSFGIVVRDLRLLQFSNFKAEFSFPQYQLQLGPDGPSVGNTITVGPQLTDRSILMLRFIIRQDVATPFPTTDVTTLPTTDTVTTLSQTEAKTPLLTTNGVATLFMTDAETQTDTLGNITEESSTANPTQLSVSSGFIAGIAVGGCGAVILIALLVTAIAIPTAIWWKKRRPQLETGHNEAYGLHFNNPETMEDVYYDSITPKELSEGTQTHPDGMESTPSIPKYQSEDSTCESVQSTREDSKIIEEATLHVNTAYSAHVNPDLTKKEIEYDYIDSVTRVSSKPNEAYGVHTDHVTTSTNQAYGVTSVKVVEDTEYEYTDHILVSAKT